MRRTCEANDLTTKSTIAPAKTKTLITSLAGLTRIASLITPYKETWEPAKKVIDLYLKRTTALASKYIRLTPAGDQPEAIGELLAGIKAQEKDQVLLGVTGSGKTFTMAHVIQQISRPIIVLAPNKTLAAQLYGEMKSFFPKNAVEYFVSYYDYYQPEAYVPRSDTYIEKDASINEQIDRMRHAATRALIERRDVVIVASVSCIYGIGSLESHQSMTVPLKIGDKIEIAELLKRLLNYNTGAMTKILSVVTSVFVATTLRYSRYITKTAWRISFFGDEIEEIYEFDPLTGERVVKLEKATIFANSHYVTPRPTVLQAISLIKSELKQRLSVLEANNKLLEAQRLEQRTNFDLEMLETTGHCAGIENYSRFLTGRAPGEPPPTLFEYIPDDALLIVDESHVTVPQVGACLKGTLAANRPLRSSAFDYLHVLIIAL